MSHIRDFNNRERPAPARSLEDAPQGMRQELIDLFFSLIEHLPRPNPLPPDQLHQVICQSLGVQTAANPYGGFRYADGRDIARVAWPRVYDVISRLWAEYYRVGVAGDYLEGVNRILAGHGSAWELRGDGRLHRVLPIVLQQQVAAAFAELQDARNAPALALLTAASSAYDDRPRRDRDACANAFDAVESLAKIKYAMPRETFGGVLRQLRGATAFNSEVLGVLESINTLRNRNFGHGMAAPLNLTGAEVDFTYLICVAAILLLSRTS
ncbi:MAG: hypothetical protein M3447_11280 [Acidobacteriota bacterium]|nr:hypothetical protein [Acidobacteriota bacterium]